MRKRWRMPRVVGPLFGYDLVASTRRGQHSGLRVFIAVLLLVTLYVVYASQVQGFDPFANPFAAGRTIHPNAMANLAGTFFRWCMIVQLFAILLVTPIVVADAIAREKERRALDFLFVTALTDREIILGKLGSRLAYLVGVLLTGLPILSLIQLFGGVDPNVLLSEYVSLLSTMVSLGALCLYCSVVAKTALQATIWSYVAAFGYLTLCPCLMFTVVDTTVAIPGLIAYAAGHFAFAASLVWISIHDLRPRADVLPPPIVPQTPRTEKNKRRAATIAIARALAVDTDSETELPIVLAVEDSPTPVDAVKPEPIEGWEPIEWRNLDHPAIWEPPELMRPTLPEVNERRPLLWKEVYLHSFTATAAGGQPVIGVLLIMAAVLALLLWLAMIVTPDSAPDVVGYSNGLVKIATVILGGLLALGAIAHSANSVTREREKDTLDALLTLPVNRATVLAAKWLGGLTSLRLLIAALAGVWVFGIATGGLHPLAMMALALSVAAVVEFVASLGLCLSVLCKTSLRANMGAMLFLTMLGVGPWVLCQYIDILAPYSGTGQANSEAIMDISMPVMSWLQLCVGWADYAKVPAGRFPAILLGALVYATAAWLLWRAALRRFCQYGGKPS